MDAKETFKWGTLISCGLSCFVGFVDFSIVNTALPAIQKDLGASLLQMQWTMNIFVLAVSIFVVMMGRLADVFGRKLLNLLGVALFATASLMAGISPNSTWLIIGRFLQGMAMAALFPTAIALISHAFPGEQKGKAIGIWSSITGAGMLIGPVLGGIFVSALTWRWIFYINIPFCLASLAATLFFVEESRNPTAEKKIDLKGFFLLAVWISSLVVGFLHAPDWGWMDWKTLSLFGAALLFLALFYISEKSSPYPTISFELFANPLFFSCALAMVCLIFFINASFFLMPLYLQNIRQEAPYVAGLMLLPITAAMVLISPFAGHWLEKIGAKRMLVGGLFLFFLSAALQAMLSKTDSPLLFLVSALLLGIGWAVARNAATTKAVSSVPHHLAGTSSGVLWTLQNIGGSLGLAVTITIFRRIYQTDLSTASFLAGYHAAMWLLAALCFVTLATVWVLLRK